MLQQVNRPQLIVRGTFAPKAGSGEIGPPGSGATITLWDSTAGSNGREGNPALPFSRIVLTVESSNDSAANGVVFAGSSDNGTNFDTLLATQYTAASGLMTFDQLLPTAQAKVTYQNSANVLTSWRFSLIGYYDRNKGT